MSVNLNIPEDDYLYIYFSNESDKEWEVFFDDFKVTLDQKYVSETTDYYPFGLVMRQFRFNEEESYRYGYQGQFSEEDTTTGWNSFELRMYDPVIGRWLSTDPYAQYWSPYLGMGNSPINGVDPDGGFFDDIFVDTKTNTTRVVDTDGPDRLWVDGEYLGYTGMADGGWKDLGFENVSFFNSYSLFFNDVYGDRLLNDNFFARQMDALGSRDLQGEFFEARVRQAIGTYGTQTALTTISVPLAIIGAGELLGAAAYHQVGASLLRYPNANGVGLNITKGGRSVFRLDWHKFRIGGRKLGRDVNRPHVDIPGKGVKHWPWHQLDKWMRGVK